jgi:phage terminase large subunit-like protein
VIDQLKTTVSGLIPINPGSDSKYVRALAVTPFVEARQIHLPSDTAASWAGEFVEEAAMFPNSTHDDQVDAMTQALTRLLGRNYGPVQVMSPVGWVGSGTAHLGGLRGPR